MENNKISVKQTWSYIFQQVKPFYFNITIVILVSLVDATFNSVSPYVLKVIINTVSDSPTQDLFSNLIIPIIVFISFEVALEVAWRLYGYFFGIKMIPQLRKNIINYNTNKILNQSYSFYQSEYSGKLSHNLIRLSKTVPEIIETVLNKFLSTILTLFIGVFVLSTINIKFAIINLSWTISIFLIILSYNKKLVKQSDNLSKHNSKISGKIVDILSNILSVKLFSGKKIEAKETYLVTDASMKSEKKLEITYLKFFTILSISFIIFQSFSLYFLIKLKQINKVTIGDFALVLNLNNTIIHVFWHNVIRLSEFSKIVGEAQQSLKIINAPISIVDNSDAKILNIKEGHIKFNKITFKYNNKDKPIFSNFSISIPSKQKLGIVGYSGGGKSTFIKLLLRLYDIQKGDILIDNQNIVSIKQDSLRSCIGMIPQDTSLFHRTLKENILYGKLNSTQKELIEASKKAYAHEFINKTKKGYQSLVGERGVKISGGQRQRISIARIILKNAPILILDEATSQLDSITEKFIQDSIKDLMKDKTTIVIAHRLSTLLQMDRIVVLDSGKIVEDGTHEDLLKQKGQYYNLWNTQNNGFIPNGIKM